MTPDEIDWNEILDELAAHNVAKVEVKFKGQMIQETHIDPWHFEPDKHHGWQVQVEDAAGNVLDLYHGRLGDGILDFDAAYEDMVGGFCRVEIEDQLSWCEEAGDTAEGTLVINAAERSINITGTKETMAPVTLPINTARKVEQKKAA
jgi:hypothetical protein